MKKLKGWRTIILNLLMGIYPMTITVQTILASPEAAQVFDAKTLAVYSLFMMTMNMILRAITTTPMGDRGE